MRQASAIHYPDMMKIIKPHIKPQTKLLGLHSHFR